MLVGSEARGQRLEIRTALSVAEVKFLSGRSAFAFAHMDTKQGLAKKASSTRPFTPTIHALVFPTQIPTDLLLTFRELDEFVLVSCSLLRGTITFS